MFFSGSVTLCTWLGVNQATYRYRIMLEPFEDVVEFVLDVAFTPQQVAYLLLASDVSQTCF
jgi:hypothetical protein